VKVATLYNFHDIRIEDVPIPKIGPYDALIKTGACGICSGDVMTWYIEKKAPLVVGHEPAGQIVEMGSSIVTHHPLLSIGDRVFVHHHAPCMTCNYCKRNDYVQCQTWSGTRIVPGGISEYILIPDINLRHDTLLLPATVSYEDGTLIEPVGCVVKSLRRASIKKGDILLIIGLGVMGQMHVLLAREFGAGMVIGADKIRFRLNKAREFGADHVIDVSRENLTDRMRELSGGLMANIVVVGPNSIDAIKQGLQNVSRGGTVVLFTPARPHEILSLDPNDLYFKDISIVTTYSCGPNDTREALRLIRGGLVTADKLVTHRFAIKDTETAFRITAEAGESLKCLIVF